nr:diguanylate cyclase [uncultured Devosia sp.]
MTLLATSKDQTADHFWGRVRSALQAMRPVRQPAYGQAAIARSIGMKPKLGTLIEEEMHHGWANAAQHNVSLSLLVIEIDRANEYYAAYDKPDTDAGVLAVMRTIVDCLPRAGDSCLRLGRGGFVVVLPDLPALMARTLALKITDAVRRQSVANKVSHAGVVTVGIGLAVTNPLGNYDRRFFEAGAEAVKKGQRRGLGKLEIVDLRPRIERKRQKHLKQAKAA